MLHQGLFNHTLENHYLPVLPSYWDIKLPRTTRNSENLKQSSPNPNSVLDPFRTKPTMSAQDQPIIDSNGVYHFTGDIPTHERLALAARMKQEEEIREQKKRESQTPHTQARRDGNDGNRPQPIGHYASPLKKSSTMGMMPPPQSRPRANALPTSSSSVALQASHQKSHRKTASTSSRRLSASFTPGGPLTSNPTTAYSSVTASNAPSRISSTTRGTLTKSNTSSNLPMPASHHPDSSRLSLTGVPSSKTHRHSLSTTYGTLTKSNTSSNLPLTTSYLSDSRRSTPAGVPSSKASIATTYTNATAHPKRENIPPSTSQAKFPKAPPDSLDAARAKLFPKMTRTTSTQKGNTGHGIPKSHSMNVFGSLTNSLSRPSLASFARNESRNPSTSTTTSTMPTTRQEDSITATDRRPRLPTSSSMSLATSSKKRSTEPPKIYKAQCSAYWTGRFVSMHDKLRTEMLQPENFSTLASVNRGENQDSDAKPSEAPSGIPVSATFSRLPTPQNKNQSSGSGSNGSGGSGSRTPKQRPRDSQKQKKVESPKKPSFTHKLTASFSTTSISSSSKTPLLSSPQKQKQKDKGKQKQQQQQQQQRDDDSDGAKDEKETHILMTMHSDLYRTKLVFQRLEALCATSEARRSLRAWQQTYARRHRCEELLPKGGSMEDREQRGWVGRLLSGSSTSGLSVAGKRASVPGGGGGGGAGAGKRGSRGGYGEFKRESFAL